MKSNSARMQILRGILIGCIAFPFLFLLISPGFFPVLQVSYHAICGPILFLASNVPKISINEDVWIPGLGAFLLVGFMIHWMGRGWAGKRGKTWRLLSTLAVTSLVPILFCVAFLVPGILLHGKLLVDTEVLIQGGRGSDRSAQRIFAMNYAQWIAYVIREESAGRYPDTHLTKEITVGGHDLIYPAAGLPVPLDATFPLLITPAYRGDKGEMKRWVCRADQEFIEIPAEDVGIWLDKALEMRRQIVAGLKSGDGT